MTAKSILARLETWQLLVITAAVGIGFYPIEPVETKIELMGALVLVTSIFFARNLGDAINSERFVNLTIIIGGLIGYIVVSGFFFSPVNDYGANKYFYAYYAFAYFGLIIPWCLYRADGAKDLTWMLMGVSLVYGLISFFPTIESDNLRYSVIGLNPTLMAKLTCIASLLIVVYRPRNKMGYVLSIGTFLFGILATINTGSRGSLIALAFAYFVFSMFRGGMLPMVKAGVALVGLVVLVYVGLQFAPIEIQDRFTLDAVSIEENSDDGDRVVLWELAVEGIRHHALGQGLGSFSLASFVAAPHNVVLESLYELGIFFSALLFVYLFFPLFRLKDLLARDNWYVDFLCVAYLYNLFLSFLGGELTLSNALIYITASMIWLLKPLEKAARRRPKTLGDVENRAARGEPALARSGHGIESAR